MRLIEVSSPLTGVTQVTLNRPKSLNALNAESVAELGDVLTAVAADRSCRGVVLTGAGRAFSAGLDLNGCGDDVQTEAKVS